MHGPMNVKLKTSFSFYDKTKFIIGRHQNPSWSSIFSPHSLHMSV